jgi:acyl-CoA thioesterase-2
VYTVERLRDGRSFTTRRVTAIQHGKAIFTLSASFASRESGLEHSAAMPAVPGPDEIETMADRLRRLHLPVDDYARQSPIDLRHVGPLPIEAEQDRSLITSNNLVWLRADGELPDDPLLHVCLMTYASDMTLLDTVLLAHGVSWSSDLVYGASLDHAMWFHRPFRVDRWLLFVQDSPVASGARGLARGVVYTAAGELVVSVVQEGLLRPRLPGHDPGLQNPS